MTRTRTITQTIGSVGLLIGLGTAAAPDAGDCNTWSAFGGGAGTVHSLIEYEGDLVILGPFSSVDGMQIPGIAAWDGTSWYPLGDGLTVVAGGGFWPQLGEFDGDLIATGLLVPNSTNAAAPAYGWDGSAWSWIGDQSCSSSAAGSLTMFEGDLVVGLRSNTECEHHIHGFDDPIRGVVRWNGEYWSEVGDSSDFNHVDALTVFEGDLIAGDHQGAVRRWDGESWELIGQMDDQISTFTEYNGDLIAGGRFTEADGLTVNQIARWTGEHWVAMAGGIYNSDGTPRVNALMVFEGELIAGGRFTHAGGTPAAHIARWTGAGWEEFEGGANDRVISMAPFGDGLAVGGSFSGLGGVSASRVGMFTPCLGPPIGACCVNGNCIEVDEQFCATIGGAYLGDETFCGDADCPPACPADLNADGVVDVLDLLMVLEAWGACPD